MRERIQFYTILNFETFVICIMLVEYHIYINIRFENNAKNIHVKEIAMREKCPNTQFFLVRIFLYSVRIQKSADQKRTRIWTSEYRKARTRKNSMFGHVSRSVVKSFFSYNWRTLHCMQNVTSRKGKTNKMRLKLVWRYFWNMGQGHKKPVASFKTCWWHQQDTSKDYISFPCLFFWLIHTFCCIVSSFHVTFLGQLILVFSRDLYYCSESLIS